MSYATVWLDHHEARIFRLSSRGVDKATVRPAFHPERRHTRGASPTAHPDDDRRFFADVSAALSGYAHILVIGPSSAKLELVTYARDHDHALEERIDAVRTVDHPSDGQIVAFGKKYFKLVDE